MELQGKGQVCDLSKLHEKNSSTTEGRNTMSDQNTAILVLVLTGVVIVSGLTISSLYYENKDLKKEVKSLEFDVKLYTFESRFYQDGLWDVITETNYTFVYVRHPYIPRAIATPYPRTGEGYSGWVESILSGKCSYNSTVVENMDSWDPNEIHSPGVQIDSTVWYWSTEKGELITFREVGDSKEES